LAEVPTPSRGSLRLSFAVSSELGAAIPHDQSYDLRLIDPEGDVVLFLKVSADIVDPVVLAKAEVFISMAPDGTIAANVDGIDRALDFAESIELDRLVSRSIDPEMLRDEPNLPAMLALLRERLMNALREVETAIGRS
jgi:hypothetical protein